MIIPLNRITMFTLCLLVYLVGVGAFTLFSAHQARKAFIADMDQRLLLAAKGLSYMLAPDFHDRATTPDAIPLAEVLENQRRVSSYALDSGFTYLYTVIAREGAFYFAAPTVTEEEYQERQNWYFYPYADIPDAFVRAFESGETAYISYHDQWGMFRSVALPLISPGGRSYLACADMNIGFINRKIREAYLRTMCHGGYFILLTLPFTLSHLYYNRRLKRSNKALSRHREELEQQVRQRTQALEKEKNRVEASNRLKSQFMANVSHEIRTPLNSILGFAELINENTSQGEMIRYADFITQSGEHMFQLVDQLLDHARITSGQLKLVVRSFDLPDFLNTLIHSEKITARRKGLSLKFTRDKDLPQWVEGDAFRLRQVLINLISNAVKFTPQGGDIHIHVTCERPGDAAEPWITFSVKDTGIGIPPEKLESIFAPFVQANEGMARIFGGTGLGTTIAKELVTRMGGRIHVENNKGPGCRFWFTLPLPQTRVCPHEEEFPEALSSAALYLPRRSGTILVVDDYPINLALSRRQLEAGGHKVVTAESGMEAITRYQKQDFDLILMDINMAGMDGCQTTRCLINGSEKENRDTCGRNGQPPIIAMTATADNQTLEKCRHAGMVDVITKPVKRSQILDMVDKWLHASPGPLRPDPTLKTTHNPRQPPRSPQKTGSPPLHPPLTLHRPLKNLSKTRPCCTPYVNSSR